MIHKLKKAGAKEIYAIISCPALLYSCIKDPKGKNFIAHGLEGNVEQIGEQVAEKIGAEMVCYPTKQELKESIGLEDLCMACIDGKYPVNKKYYTNQK